MHLWPTPLLARVLLIGLAVIIALFLALLALHRKRELYTEIWIDRLPEQVWKIFADTRNYPSWNPLIHSFEGEIRTGNIITIEIGSPGSKSLVFKPRILAAQRNVELRWLGKLAFGGLFDGEHHFQLLPENHGTRFIQSERFSGLLIGPLTDSVLAQTKRGFEAMNQALKTRAESWPRS
jgi:hypothetical protein